MPLLRICSSLQGTCICCESYLEPQFLNPHFNLSVQCKYFKKKEKKNIVEFNSEIILY